MMTLLYELSQKFHHATQLAFPSEEISLNKIEIAPSTQEKFGHYQYNSAMKLARILKKSPQEIAKAILAQVDLNTLNQQPMIAHCEIAGPGFINITLDPSYLASRLQNTLNDPALGIDQANPPQKIIIDFSSPNTAKEMHVGHLRSTIIGDCLARLFEFQGNDVVRLNHIGDWGTPFGMLIAYMKETAPKIIEGIEQTDLIHLMTWYKLSKNRFDNDAEFKKRAQDEVVAMQSGNPKSLQIWSIICDISRKAYQEIYDLLDIKITERGESFYNPFLKDIVADLEKKGLVTLSDGAKCIFLENFPLPLIIQKSDGGYNYSTTDLAAIRHRIHEEKVDRIVYVTDAGQVTHFQMIFKAAELAGYLDLNKIKIDHVPFGLVLGPDGKKFKSRSGNTERLIDLILTAIDKAKTILAERNPDMDKQELEATAKILGINAIKYADLSCNRVGDYMFSYDRMLRFEGNTAAFIMYAYVRINSIKRKIGVESESLKTTTKIELQHPAEIELGVHLNQFGEILEQITKDFLPHHLTEYLFQLAEKFNVFFRDCRVGGDPAQNSRLLLCDRVGKVLSKGLEILGLRLVERM